jgi:hypothetical protein
MGYEISGFLRHSIRLPGQEQDRGILQPLQGAPSQLPGGLVATRGSAFFQLPDESTEVPQKGPSLVGERREGNCERSL